MNSRIRRKPLITYKSPTAEDRGFITRTTSYSKSKESSSTPKPTPKHSRSFNLPKEPPSRTNAHHKRLMSPPLPLYHPFGALAISLPPLNPEDYGLPLLPIPEDAEEKSSSRSRRPSAKIRELEEEAVAPTVSSIAAVAAREAKERASPKKRRTGGAKRKRKDPEDGDATYPAKRTRMPRGQNADEDPAMDVGVVPDLLSDLVESAKRRPMRAKGGLKRRDSSGSDTASIAASVNASSAPPGPDATTSRLADAETASQVEGTDLPGADDTKDEEREEGELSEEQTNP